MKELNMKKVRQEMYKEIKERKSASNKESSAIIRESQNQVLIESRGTRTFVPSMMAFRNLVTEHDSLKVNHNRALKEINVLKDSINKLIRAVNEMDEELKKKIDLPDV